jgi:hypothetical protein
MPFEQKVAPHHTTQRKGRQYRAVEALSSYMRKRIDGLSQLQAGQVPDPHVPQCKDEEPAPSCNEYAIGPLRLLNTVDSTLNGTPSSVTIMVEQEFVRRTVPQDDEDPPQWHWFTKQWPVVMCSSSDIEALFNSIQRARMVLSTSTSPISKCSPLNQE